MILRLVAQKVASLTSTQRPELVKCVLVALYKCVCLPSTFS